MKNVKQMRIGCRKNSKTVLVFPKQIKCHFASREIKNKK
ncbi:MAG: hypothetical protein JWP81_4603 [Ferruginibacter sp.]|nr:hypothetical protein [Ferruginibacter sp.]